MTSKHPVQIDPPPEHLVRSKAVFDRYMAGDAFTDIADEMGISPTRVRQLFDRWIREVHRYNRIQKLGRERL